MIVHTNESSFRYITDVVMEDLMEDGELRGLVELREEGKLRGKFSFQAFRL